MKQSGKVTNKQLLTKVNQLEGLLVTIGQHLVQVQKYLGDGYTKFWKEEQEKENKEMSDGKE